MSAIIDAARFGRRLVEWADRVGASDGNFLGPNSARALELIRADGHKVTAGCGFVADYLQKHPEFSDLVA